MAHSDRYPSTCISACLHVVLSLTSLLHFAAAQQIHSLAIWASAVAAPPAWVFFFLILFSQTASLWLLLLRLISTPRTHLGPFNPLWPVRWLNRARNLQTDVPSSIPHGRKREPTPTNCPLMSTCSLHKHAYKVTYIHACICV